MRKRRVRHRNTSKKVSIIALFVFIIIAAIGYATINSSVRMRAAVEVKESTWDVHMDNIRVLNNTLEDNESITLSEDKTTVNFNVTLDTLIDFYEFDIDVVNSGSMDAMLTDYQIQGLSDTQKEYLNFDVNYVSTGELQLNEILYANEYKVLNIRIGYNEFVLPENIPTGDENLNLSVTLVYEKANKNVNKTITFGRELTSRKMDYESGHNFYQKLLNDSMADTGINYSQTSSSTNGQGLYKLSSTQSDSNPILFYRGNVDNNYVVVEDSCFKVIRTTSNGSIRLIYHGNAYRNYNDGNEQYSCDTNPATWDAVTKYNENNNDNAYVGYMYGQTDSSTFDETHANIYDSKIKQKIETKYSGKYISFSYKDIENDIWCNNRMTLNSGFGLNQTTYNEFSYLSNSSFDVSKLTCEREEDRFSLDKVNGNGKLNYPVGTITALELQLAGYVNGGAGNSNTYLSSYAPLWTMTPAQFSSNQAKVFALSSSNVLEPTNVSEEYNSGFMITLKRGVQYLTGDGTRQNPYLIKPFTGPES